MGKKISKNCIDLVKEFEGLSLKAYKDEVGVWTIGYGITSSDKAVTGKTITGGMTITKRQAEDWLEESLNRKYLPLVLMYDNKYNWNQNELDALVSFAYNVGSIGQLTAKGTRSKSVIASKILLYNKAGGKVFNGLTRRRKAERELFLKKVETKKYTGNLTDPKKVSERGYWQKGDTSKYVKEIKAFLNWYFGLSLNTGSGEYGAKTKKYVNKFRKSVGLSENGKWGHASYSKAIAMKDKGKASAPSVKSKKVDDFISFLEKEHNFVKNNSKYFSRHGSVQRTWEDTKKRVKAHKVAGISCCYPEIWYFRSKGINNALHGVNGSFRKSFNSKLAKLLTRITKGSCIGITVKQAVDKGLLRRGDIIAFKGATHTAVYTGSGYKVYDGGSTTQKIGYGKIGIKPDYSKGYYKNKKISEILRWK